MNSEILQLQQEFHNLVDSYKFKVNTVLIRKSLYDDIMKLLQKFSVDLHFDLESVDNIIRINPHTNTDGMILNALLGGRTS